MTAWDGLRTQNDPDHGMYTYTYDALGQKLSEVSPKMAAASQSVTYQYDLLGRMTSRTEPEVSHLVVVVGGTILGLKLMKSH